MKKLQKKIHNILFPHMGNNHRPKLLHHSSLIIILLSLLTLIAVATITKSKAPGILGISYSITANELLEKTNEARAENGLPPLSLNEKLTQAAAGKAQDMFADNYWAHFSPDGTTPWQFINGAGYEYIYAGENLAKGFTDSGEIVKAWLASPSHRENILSPNYKEIGFAVREGSLLGEDTVLVVQMFGTSDTLLAQAPQTQSNTNAQNTVPQVTSAPRQAAEPPQVIPTAIPESVPIVAQESTELPAKKVIEKPTLNAEFVSQALTLSLVSIILFALLIDFVIVGRKKIPRMVGNNIDHILLVSVFIILILIQSSGGIL